MLGQLFESLVTLDVRVFAQTMEARAGHLRTQGGEHDGEPHHKWPGRTVVAVEVKARSAPTDADVKHLHWLQNKLGDDLVDTLVITTGRHAYRRADGVAVVPVALLGP